MQKKHLVTALILSVLLCVLIALPASAADCAHSAFTSGVCDGCGATAITTASELLTLMTDSTKWGTSSAPVSYVLTADTYNMSGKTVKPIGKSTVPFYGTFDGNGAVVTNYAGKTQNDATYGGFFGRVGAGTVIKNLTVSGSVNYKTSYTGGIVGYSANNVTIENCTSNCTVTGGGSHTGGIIGVANTGAAATITIKNCTNLGAVSNSAYAGGIIGYGVLNKDASTLTISGCVNYGNVTNSSGSGAGGIMARGAIPSVDSQITIQSCENYGKVEANSHVGGIAGYITLFGKGTAEPSAYTFTIQSCTNSGSVKAVSASLYGAGGIAGVITTSALNSTGSAAATDADKGTYYKYQLVSCVNTGAVTGHNYIAGILGHSYMANEGKFLASKCVNQGSVTATGTDIGGIVGYLYVEATIDNSESCKIRESVNAGTIKTSGATAGGIIGLMHRKAYATNCLNTGAVSAATNCGGLVGRGSESSVGINCSYNGSSQTTNAVLGGGTLASIRKVYYITGTSTALDNTNGGTAYVAGTSITELNEYSLWEECNGSIGTTVTRLPHLKNMNNTVVPVVDGTYVRYKCASCLRNIKSVQSSNATVYVDEATGSIPTVDPTATNDAIATALKEYGTATKPFKNFADAMDYAVAYANRVGDAKVEILTSATIPVEYSAPEYKNEVRITGGDDGAILTFAGGNSTQRRYYSGGEVAFEYLTFYAEEGAEDGVKVFGQNHRLAMGNGVTMDMSRTIAVSGYPAVSAVKMYVFGGFYNDDIPSVVNKMNTNVVIRSGSYWVVAGWNNGTASYDASGKGVMSIGTARSTDSLFINYIIGYSSGVQELSGASKMTISIDGPVDCADFYYGTQHGPVANIGRLYETDLVLKQKADLNVVARTGVKAVDIFATASAQNTKLNVYVDKRSGTAIASAAPFYGSAQDADIAAAGTIVTSSTYVNYCATYKEGGHAKYLPFLVGTLPTDSTCTVCEECGGVTHADCTGAAWSYSNGRYNLTTCSGCSGTIQSQTATPTVYVDQSSGNNANSGLSADTAVKTIEDAARRLATTGGKIVLSAAYTFTGDVTLPAHTGEITITATAGKGIRVNNVDTDGTTKLADLTNNPVFTLNGPVIFQDIIFNSQNQKMTLVANWNDLTFGKDVVTYGSVNVVLGNNSVTANSTNSTEKTVKFTVDTIRPGSTGGKVYAFFDTVTLGDNVQNVAGYTVSNKTIIADIRDAEIFELYMGTPSTKEANAQMKNYRLFIDLYGDTVVKRLHTGADNVKYGSAYVDQLVLNLRDDARVGALTHTVPIGRTEGSIANLYNVIDGKFNISGTASQYPRIAFANAVPTQINVTKNISGTGLFTPTGIETVDITYTSHSFASSKSIAYNEMYNGRDTVRFVNECIKATANATTCSICGATLGQNADGLVLSSKATTSGTTVTVKLYAQSDVPLWGAKFTVKAPTGYTLDTVTPVALASDQPAGFSSMVENKSEGSYKMPCAMALLNSTAEQYSAIPTATEIATLTFTKADTAGTFSLTTDILEAYYKPISYGHGVILGSEYILEYTVVENADMTDPFIVFEQKDENGVTESSSVDPYSASGKWRFAVPGIAAKEMNDTVVGTLYYKQGQDSDLFAAQSDSYNLINYYKTMYPKLGADKYTNLRALLNAMLHYGAAAQTYFNYNTDNLVSKHLPSDYTAPSVTATSCNDKVDVDGQIYTVAGMTGELAQHINTQIYFAVTGDKTAVSDLSTLTFKGTYTDINGVKNGITLTAEGGNIYKNGSYLCVDVNCIAAKDLRQDITGALYQGNTQISQTVIFDFESYVAQTLATSTDENLNAVCRAALVYSDAAAAYLAK